MPNAVRNAGELMEAGKMQPSQLAAIGKVDVGNWKLATRNKNAEPLTRPPACRSFGVGRKLQTNPTIKPKTKVFQPSTFNFQLIRNLIFIIPSGCPRHPQAGSD
jgi:hypothetical protein